MTTLDPAADYERTHKRDNLPPLERAVSDALDEYMIRLHGIFTSWAYPQEFIIWLGERGYIIHAKETEPDTGVE